MHRRHQDADRRRALVRKLNTDRGPSVRKISSITGWSKSTVDRDLRRSPFEESAERNR
jgi:IS30 family transposase